MKHEALSFLQTRIGRRFLGILLIISLLPLLAMRWLAMRKSEAAISEQTTAVLRSASDAAEAQLREFLDHLKESLLRVARDVRLQDALQANSQSPSNETNNLARILRALAPLDAQALFLLDQRGKLIASTTSSPVSQHGS